MGTASECEANTREFVETRLRSVFASESLESIDEATDAVVPPFIEFKQRLWDVCPEARAQVSTSKVLKQYLEEIVEKMGTAHFAGRSVPYLDAVPPTEWLLAANLDESCIANLARIVAHRDRGLSEADSEILADKIAIAVLNAVKKDPDLKSRMLSEPKLLRAYVRTAARREAQKVNAQNERREQGLRDKTLDATESISHLRLIIDEALPHAGLTDTEQRRVLSALSGTSNSQMARDENCNEAAIRKSITNAVSKIKAYLWEGKERSSSK